MSVIAHNSSINATTRTVPTIGATTSWCWCPAMAMMSLGAAADGQSNVDKRAISDTLITPPLAHSPLCSIRDLADEPLVADRWWMKFMVMQISLSHLPSMMVMAAPPAIREVTSPVTAERSDVRNFGENGGKNCGAKAAPATSLTTYIAHRIAHRCLLARPSSSS